MDMDYDKKLDVEGTAAIVYGIVGGALVWALLVGAYLYFRH